MGKRKTIVCLETGKQFNSVENAANAIGVSSGFISRQIKARKPIKGFHYYYAGEMLPDEYRQKIRNQKKKPNYKSRPVICLETGERFESISLVSRMLGISKSNVFHAMKNGSAVHGIHFYYGDEPKPVDSFFKPKRRRKVRCTETGNQFVSLSDAARAVGLRNGNSIRRAIDRGGTAGGYHWKYLDEKKEVSTDDHHQADGRAE